MTLRYRTMNQHDALYTLARRYPGGIEALAARMGMSSNVLRNKLRPNIDTHHVTSEEESLVVEMCEEAGVQDPKLPLMAKNWRHGLLAFPMPEVADLADSELNKLMFNAMKEFSDLTQAASAALADGIVNESEMDSIEKEAREALAAIVEIRERARMRAQQVTTPRLVAGGD